MCQLSSVCYVSSICNCMMVSDFNKHKIGHICVSCHLCVICHLFVIYVSDVICVLSVICYLFVMYVTSIICMCQVSSVCYLSSICNCMMVSDLHKIGHICVRCHLCVICHLYVMYVTYLISHLSVIICQPITNSPEAVNVSLGQTLLVLSQISITLAEFSAGKIPAKGIPGSGMGLETLVRPVVPGSRGIKPVTFNFCHLSSDI